MACIVINYNEYIVIEPATRSGKPCIKGTRISVYDILGYLADGMTQENILSDFPQLTLQDIRACLAFCADPEKKYKQHPTTLKQNFRGSLHLTDEERNDFQRHVANGR